MKYRTIAVLIAAGWMTGCMVGPNYHRPAVQVPQNFRAPDPLPNPQAESFADLKWWEVFKDPDLQELVKTALQQNYDLRDAVTRVEAARANLGITRSDQLAFGVGHRVSALIINAKVMPMLIAFGPAASAKNLTRFS